MWTITRQVAAAALVLAAALAAGTADAAPKYRPLGFTPVSPTAVNPGAVYAPTYNYTYSPRYYNYSPYAANYYGNPYGFSGYAPGPTYASSYGYSSFYSSPYASYGVSRYGYGYSSPYAMSPYYFYP